MPPASIGLILQHPGEMLNFATMVERVRMTPDEARAIAQIRPDQWQQLIRSFVGDPTIAQAIAAAPRARNLRSVAEQPEVKSALRRGLEMAGIIAGVVLAVSVALGGLLLAIGALLAAIGAIATLGAVVFALFGIVIAGIGLLSAGVSLIGLIVYFLPENDPRARAIGTQIFGGSGGGAFIDDVALVRRVAKVSIRHGQTVDAIQFTWELDDGSLRSGPRHGGGGGQESTITLEADEYITKITGRAGAMIDQLAIATSKGRSYGPYGGNGGDVQFTLEPDLGDRILGLHGRSGARLDALGVLSPAYGSGMHGGSGGDPFLDEVPVGGRIQQIVVRYGIYVDSIEVQWVDFDGKVYNGTRHGGGGGEHSRVVKLADDEWIARVSGRAGQLLDRLELLTNKGTRHEFGDRGGNLFNIDVEPGERITGFFGRAGSYIDAIGVCVARVTQKPLVIGERIALQSNHGPFLGVHEGKVVASAGYIGPEELFRIVAVDGQADGAPLHLGATVALRGESGKYLSTRAAPELRPDADAIGDAERFTLVHPISPMSTAGLAAGEVVALCSKQGQFVLTSAQRVVHVDATTPGADGTWLVHRAAT